MTLTWPMRLVLLAAAVAVATPYVAGLLVNWIERPEPGSDDLGVGILAVLLAYAGFGLAAVLLILAAGIRLVAARNAAGRETRN